jgi:hypothetical protein
MARLAAVIGDVYCVSEGEPSATVLQLTSFQNQGVSSTRIHDLQRGSLRFQEPGSGAHSSGCRETVQNGCRGPQIRSRDTLRWCSGGLEP